MNFEDGRRRVDEDALQNSVLEVTQEWKGGTSGTSVDQWRNSLDESTSSNWQVIDRLIGKCVGIWTWSTRPYVRTALCDHWYDVYSAQPGMRPLAISDIPRDCSPTPPEVTTTTEAAASTTTTTTQPPEEVTVNGNTCALAGGCTESIASCPEQYTVRRCTANLHPGGLHVPDDRTCRQEATSPSRASQVVALCSRTRRTQVRSRSVCTAVVDVASVGDVEEARCPRGNAIECYCVLRSGDPCERVAQSGPSCSISMTTVQPWQLRIVFPNQVNQLCQDSLNFNHIYAICPL